MSVSIHAQVVITEVMYQPTSETRKGYQWIEVVNDGEVAVDVTELQFHVGDRSHVIFEHNKGSSIPSGAVAVIVQHADTFHMLYPDRTQRLFISDFTIPNEKTTIGISATETGQLENSISFLPTEPIIGTGATQHIVGGGKQIIAPATPGIIATNPIPTMSSQQKKKNVTLPLERVATVESLKERVMQEQSVPLTKTEESAREALSYTTVVSAEKVQERGGVGVVDGTISTLTFVLRWMDIVFVVITIELFYLMFVLRKVLCVQRSTLQLARKSCYLYKKNAPK